MELYVFADTVNQIFPYTPVEYTIVLQDVKNCATSQNRQQQLSAVSENGENDLYF